MTIKFKTLEYLNVGCFVLLLMGLAVWQTAFVGWMAIGALVMSLNISVMGRVLSRLLGGSAGRGMKAVLIGFLGLKTLFLGLAVFLLFHYLAAGQGFARVEPLGFVTGAVCILLVPMLFLGALWLKTLKPLKLE